jgi:hypothetical protein
MGYFPKHLPLIQFFNTEMTIVIYTAMEQEQILPTLCSTGRAEIFQFEERDNQTI